MNNFSKKETIIFLISFSVFLLLFIFPLKAKGANCWGTIAGACDPGCQFTSFSSAFYYSDAGCSTSPCSNKAVYYKGINTPPCDNANGTGSCLKMSGSPFTRYASCGQGAWCGSGGSTCTNASGATCGINVDYDYCYGGECPNCVWQSDQCKGTLVCGSVPIANCTACGCTLTTSDKYNSSLSVPTAVYSTTPPVACVWTSPALPFDFSLSSPDPVTSLLAQGDLTSTTVKATLKPGTTGGTSITFSYSGFPTGVIVSGGNNTCTPTSNPDDCKTTLMITIPNDSTFADGSKDGSYTININASGGGKGYQALPAYILQIQHFAFYLTTNATQQPPYSPFPLAMDIFQGHSQQVIATVVKTSGPDKEVSLYATATNGISVTPNIASPTKCTTNLDCNSVAIDYFAPINSTVGYGSTGIHASVQGVTSSCPRRSSCNGPWPPCCGPDPIFVIADYGFSSGPTPSESPLLLPGGGEVATTRFTVKLLTSGPGTVFPTLRGGGSSWKGVTVNFNPTSCYLSVAGQTCDVTMTVTATSTAQPGDYPVGITLYTYWSSGDTFAVNWPNEPIINYMVHVGYNYELEILPTNSGKAVLCDSQVKRNSLVKVTDLTGGGVFSTYQVFFSSKVSPSTPSGMSVSVWQPSCYVIPAVPPAPATCNEYLYITLDPIVPPLDDPYTITVGGDYAGDPYYHTDTYDLTVDWFRMNPPPNPQDVQLCKGGKTTIPVKAFATSDSTVMENVYFSLPQSSFSGTQLSWENGINYCKPSGPGLSCYVTLVIDASSPSVLAGSWTVTVNEDTDPAEVVCNTKTSSFNLTIVEFDFSLQANNASICKGGSSAQTTVIARNTGAGICPGQDITFSYVSGLPTGVTMGSILPCFTGSGSCPSLITLSNTSGLSPGTYPNIKIRGTASGGKIHEASFSLIVRDFSYSLSVSPVAGEVHRGNTASPTVNANLNDCGGSSINLSASGIPTGANLSFSQNNLPPTFSSAMIISTFQTTVIGNYNIDIKGSGGGIADRHAFYSLRVCAADFSISASPVSQTVNPGGTATTQISTGLVGSFGDQVTLSIDPPTLPAGVTYSFSPDNICTPGTIDDKADLTFQIPLGTTLGTYPIRIIGTVAGGCTPTPTNSTTYTLTVTAPGDFSITVNPTGASVKQGDPNPVTPLPTVRVAVITPPAPPSVALSINQAPLIPEGITAVFQATGTNSYTCSSFPCSGIELNITTSSTTPITTAINPPYSIVITGTAGAISHTATFSLTVTPPPQADMECEIQSCGKDVQSGLEEPGCDCDGNWITYNGFDVRYNIKNISAGNIVKSEWSLVGPASFIPSVCIDCDMMIQPIAPGNYMITLKVTDNDGASSVATHPITIKQDIIAKFECSLVDPALGPWGPCSGFIPVVGYPLFFKDNSSVSEGALGISDRIWSTISTVGTTVFDSLNHDHTSIPITGTSINKIGLIVRDDTPGGGRTDYAEQNLSPILPLPKWKEIRPF
jgi:hypothetical protein